MLILTTGTPSAIITDERVIVSIPSGSDALEITMTVHEALRLGETLYRTARGMVSLANQQASAEIIPLKRKRRKMGGK